MAKIYKIQPTCECEPWEIYYGSTKQKLLCSRMAGHRNDYKKYNNGTHHWISAFYLFDKYGLENCKIMLVEKLGEMTKDEMLKKESEYILNNKCVNASNPKPMSKEDIAIYRKEYYQTKIKTDETKLNKLKKTAKEFLDKKEEEGPIVCECGETYTYRHKSRHMKTDKHRLGTDEEYRKQCEEKKEIEKEERIKRIKEYKAKWHQENKNK